MAKAEDIKQRTPDAAHGRKNGYWWKNGVSKKAQCQAGLASSPPMSGPIVTPVLHIRDIILKAAVTFVESVISDMTVLDTPSSRISIYISKWHMGHTN